MAKLRLTKTQAKTSINWYVSHGYNFADTLTRLQERFSRVGNVDVQSLYKYYKSTHTRALNLAGYRPTYIVEPENFPSFLSDPTRVRTTVNFDFYNPSLSRRVRRSAIVDLPGGLSKKDLLDLIRAKILYDMIAIYEFRQGLSEAGRRIKNIRVVQIEGV